MKYLLPNHTSGPAPVFYTGDDAIRSCVDRLARTPRVSCDIETRGLGALSYQVKVIILSDGVHTAVLNGLDPRHRTVARHVTDNVSEIDFHNSPFDVPPLYLCGAMSLDAIRKVTDTLIWARMAYQGLMGRGLEDLEPRLLAGQFRHAVKDRLSKAAKVAGFASKAAAFDGLQYDDPVYTMYAAWDAVVTHRIHDPIYAAAFHQQTNHPFDGYGADAETAHYLLAREQAVNRVTLRRSALGMRIDRGEFARQSSEVEQRQNYALSVLNHYEISDPSNRGQLIAALEKAQAFPPNHPRTKENNVPSTAKKNLEKIDHPVINAFREYDEQRRRLGYITEALAVADATDGRVHPKAHIGGAETGRMSMSEPPIHQFQGVARHVILADEGHRVASIDWSSIEPVVAASLTGDTMVLDRYDAGHDLYEPMAIRAGISRKNAKIQSLADLYGEGIKKMAGALDVDESEAAEIRALMRSTMPRTGAFIEYSRRWGELTGKTWSVSGRIMDIDAQHAYKATNYTVQGSAYDQLAESIVEIDRQGMGDHFLIAMHDEIVCHGVVAHEIQRIMETPLPRLVHHSGRSNRLRTDLEIMGEYWADPEVYLKIQEAQNA